MTATLDGTAAAQMAIRDAMRRPASRERVHALARAHGEASLAWRERADRGDQLAAAAADNEMKLAMDLWSRLGMVR